jgi:hypothetical protein
VKPLAPLLPRAAVENRARLRVGHGTLRSMENTARSGLGTRIIAWAVLIVVALFVLKFAFGLVIGLIQFVFVLAILAVVALGVIWALRHI